MLIPVKHLFKFRHFSIISYIELPLERYFQLDSQYSINNDPPSNGSFVCLVKTSPYSPEVIQIGFSNLFIILAAAPFKKNLHQDYTIKYFDNAQEIQLSERKKQSENYC